MTTHSSLYFGVSVVPFQQGFERRGQDEGIFAHIHALADSVWRGGFRAICERLKAKIKNTKAKIIRSLSSHEHYACSHAICETKATIIWSLLFILFLLLTDLNCQAII